MKLRWFRILFINLPLILFIVMFVYVTITLLPVMPNNDNLFVAYAQSHLATILFPAALFIFFFILFILNGAKLSANQSGRRKLFKPVVRYAFVLIFIALVSFPISFAVVYIYAFAQINYHILSYNSGSTEKNFITSPQAIADAIAGTDKLSFVPLSPETYKKDLLLLSMKKKDGFYEDRFLTSFPNALYKRSYIPNVPMAFVNNYLVFSSLTPSQLSIISPALGKFLIEHSTERSIIKPLPEIAILEKDAYVAVRKKHIASQINQIDTVITSIDGSIASVSGFIADNEKSIASNQELIAKAKEQQQKASCKTPEKCALIKAKWDKVKLQASTNIAKAQAVMQQNQTVLGTSIRSKENLTSTKDEIGAKVALTNYELGLFAPPQKITMTLQDSEDPKSFDAYLATLIHEYFHYLSYIDEDTTLDHFFEEALTEHFSRIAFENYTGQKTDLGYQVGVRIISAMTKNVSEKELLAIYYAKDQKALEALLNNTYGATFYEDNKSAFSMLNNLPFEESVNVANLIMQQIDGDELKITNAVKSNAFTVPAPDSTEDLPYDGQSTAEIPVE